MLKWWNNHNFERYMNLKPNSKSYKLKTDEHYITKNN